MHHLLLQTGNAGEPTAQLQSPATMETVEVREAIKSDARSVPQP